MSFKIRGKVVEGAGRLQNWDATGMGLAMAEELTLLCQPSHQVAENKWCVSKPNQTIPISNTLGRRDLALDDHARRG